MRRFPTANSGIGRHKKPSKEFRPNRFRKSSRLSIFIHKLYALASVNVEYDLAKAALNLNKHGVAFEEAATALLDSLALAIEDPDYAQGV